MIIKQKTYHTPLQYLIYLIIFLLTFACSTDKTAMKEPPFVPEESFRKADELIKERKYEEAREILETIKSRDASRKYGLLAKLRIADTYFDDKSYEEAVVEYESFLDLYPNNKYASYAQYKKAMCFFSRIETVDISYSWAKKALDEFEKLRRLYPRNPYMDVIESRINTCRSILAAYEFYVGDFYYGKGSYSAAINRFEGMIKAYPDSNKVSEALYYIGLSYEHLGQRDEAVNRLTTLIARFPTIDLAAKAKKMIDSFDKEK